MADETIVGDPEPEEDASGAKKGLGKWLLLLVPLALIPATSGAYVAYTQYPELAQAAIAVGWNVHAPEAEEPERPEFGQFTSLEGLLVNPAGTGGGRYLLVDLGLEAKNAEVLEELKAKDVVVRDVVLKTLSERTVDELASINLRDALKEELRLSINALLADGQVDRLYFTKYVLQ